MQIRDIKSEDFAEVFEIIKEYKAEAGLTFSEEERVQVTETLSHAMANEKTWIKVAESNLKVVGYISAHLVPFPMLKGWECYITELFICRNERGKKIGKKLIGEIENLAKAIGLKRLMLNNFKDLKSYTGGFYKKNGFEERVRAANFVKNL